MQELLNLCSSRDIITSLGKRTSSIAVAKMLDLQHTERQSSLCCTRRQSELTNEGRTAPGSQRHSRLRREPAKASLRIETQVAPNAPDKRYTSLDIEKI